MNGSWMWMSILLRVVLTSPVIAQTLNQAVSSRDTVLVRRLLNEGADVDRQDKDGYTPMHEAAFWAKRAIGEILISRGADIHAQDKLGFTPLHAASGGRDFSDFAMSIMAVGIQGNRDIAELLISNGADVNARDKRGYTPLHWASTQGKRRGDVVALLRKHGGEP